MRPGSINKKHQMSRLQFSNAPFPPQDRQRSNVASEKEIQEKIRQLGTLVGQLEQAPAKGSGPAARELVQLLMEVHGAGLERMMEIAFESGEPGQALITRFGQDPIVRNLLLLYSLHPDDLETRVLQALDTAGRYLRKFDCKAELLGVQEGNVRVRLHAAGHSCGSTTKDLQSTVEASIYELAPDLTTLTILGPHDESASGFVPLTNLLRQPVAAEMLAVHAAETEGAD
jgi:Fe-S cluster biogenesis protein NfuA